VSVLNSLNPAQREAAAAVDGPVLILAGAGTGKTRVITHRLAHMIARGVPAGSILAVTFTNKAAREMQSRISGLLGGKGAVKRGDPKPVICTFHSLGVRILRAHAGRLGYKPNFAIYSEGDQTTVMRRLLANFSPAAAKVDPSAVLSMLSRWRNSGGKTPPTADPVAVELAERLSSKYESALRAANAVDFDDLLLQPLRLFREHPEGLEACRAVYRYVMVDEYQDTNAAQFEIAASLTEKSRNLCVVGDDDQSIYGWRGAEASNILEFEKRYPEVKVVKLEQNYRSTNIILRAANAVISRNVRRRGKQLWSEHGEGDRILLQAFDSDEDEAKATADAIEFERIARGVPWKKQAVLFRTNIQSRSIESALRQLKIRYRVVGGQSFFDRREIRDFISFLRMLANPHDDQALLRIANVPARGLGDDTMEKIVAASHQRGASVYSTFRHTDVLGALKPQARRAVTEFAAWIDATREPLTGDKAFSLARWATEWLANLGYREELRRGEKDLETADNRWMNVVELIADLDAPDAAPELPGLGTPVLRFQSEPVLDLPPTGLAVKPAAKDPVFERRVSLKPLARLEEFLDEFVLDPEREREPDADVDAVTLITIHAAKGLEFPNVHLVGLEDGLLPHSRSKSEGTIDEERRLFYVAITRAQRMLRISHCRTRRRYGQPLPCHPSPFLKELPPECVEDAAAAAHRPVPKEKGSDWFATLRAAAD
jgi:DNA helicase II / ATP-dependent DNA helicase PcrA